jgi:signal transduction histidine kinase
VVVRDTGRGIARPDRDRIFDPGFTTKGAGVGVGLGLSICSRIVADHGGTIEADSAPGQGATVTVRLPRG